MDLQILQWINQNWHGNAFLNEFFKYVTYLGEYGILWIALCVVLLLFKKTRKTALILAVALIIEYLLVNFVLKLSVNRTRPFAIDPDIKTFLTSIHLHLPGDSSFPSGHSSAAFTACTVLFLSDKKKCWPLLLLATLIAFSRIYLCVHFPTDVLAGSLIGVAVAAITFFCAKKIMRRRSI